MKLPFTRLQYFRKDSIWPSRRWNWNRTDYIDLSKEKENFKCPNNSIICDKGYACDACPYNEELK
jgi:hypothetical protein